MELFRRISNGDKVPPADEQKLLEFSQELYMAAKNMAAMKKEQGKEYDSLWGDEEKTEYADPREVAENSEISIDAPEDVSARAAASLDVEA